MKQILFQKFSGAVDVETGIISRVSVITQGEASGHGMMIDATTLEQVKTCAEAFGDGVKVKINHGDSFDSIVGVLRSFIIDGIQLRSDLHLLKSHQSYAKIVEMAQRQPETFGLSISFSGTCDKIEGVKYARCTELYSVDLVDAPAANPSGLFAAAVDSVPKDMAENFKELWSEAIEFFKSNRKTNEELSAVQSELATLKANFSTKETELSTLSKQADALKADLEKQKTDHEVALKAKDESVQSLAATKAAEIARGQGIPSVPNTPAADATKTEPEKPKLFGLAKVRASIAEQIKTLK